MTTTLYISIQWKTTADLTKCTLQGYNSEQTDASVQ